jgi:hypothetical protein
MMRRLIAHMCCRLEIPAVSPPDGDPAPDAVPVPALPPAPALASTPRCGGWCSGARACQDWQAINVPESRTGRTNRALVLALM